MHTFILDGSARPRSSGTLRMWKRVANKPTKHSCCGLTVTTKVPQKAASAFAFASEQAELCLREITHRQPAFQIQTFVTSALPATASFILSWQEELFDFRRLPSSPCLLSSRQLAGRCRLAAGSSSQV